MLSIPCWVLVQHGEPRWAWTRSWEITLIGGIVRDAQIRPEVGPFYQKLVKGRIYRGCFWWSFFLGVVGVCWNLEVYLLEPWSQKLLHNPSGMLKMKIPGWFLGKSESVHPWTFNMLNLKITQLKRKIIWTKPPWLWVQNVTPPKFNIAPEKRFFFEDYSPIGKVTFQGWISIFLCWFQGLEMFESHWFLGVRIQKIPTRLLRFCFNILVWCKRPLRGSTRPPLT